jgi:hypothetical protein
MAAEAVAATVATATRSSAGAGNDPGAERTRTKAFAFTRCDQVPPRPLPARTCTHAGDLTDLERLTHMVPVLLRVAVIGGALPLLSSATWRDPPLAASSILSLDGSDWSVKDARSRQSAPAEPRRGPTTAAVSTSTALTSQPAPSTTTTAPASRPSPTLSISSAAASSAQQRRVAPPLCGRRRRPGLRSPTHRPRRRPHRPSASL